MNTAERITKIMSADKPITEAEAERLEAIASAATPGPWQTRFMYRMFSSARKHAMQDGLLMEGDSGQDWKDAEFQVESRTALPTLIAQHRKAMQILALAEESLDCHKCVACKDGCAKEEAAELIRQWRGL